MYNFTLVSVLQSLVLADLLVTSLYIYIHITNRAEKVLYHLMITVRTVKYKGKKNVSEHHRNNPLGEKMFHNALFLLKEKKIYITRC